MMGALRLMGNASLDGGVRRDREFKEFKEFSEFRECAADNYLQGILPNFPNFPNFPNLPKGQKGQKRQKGKRGKKGHKSITTLYDPLIHFKPFQLSYISATTKLLPPMKMASLAVARLLVRSTASRTVGAHS